MLLLWKATLTLFDTWCTLFFWYLFGIAAYWFIFFKLEDRVYLLLPLRDDWYHTYRKFDIVFGLVCSCKLLAVLLQIAEQCTIDIFFIDWEKSKIEVVKDEHVEMVGCWRSIFVNNEFNEMQGKRYIDFTLTSFIFIFFMR